MLVFIEKTISYKLSKDRQKPIQINKKPKTKYKIYRVYSGWTYTNWLQKKFAQMKSNIFIDFTDYIQSASLIFSDIVSRI